MKRRVLDPEYFVEIKISNFLLKEGFPVHLGRWRYQKELLIDGIRKMFDDAYGKMMDEVLTKL